MERKKWGGGTNLREMEAVMKRTSEKKVMGAGGSREKAWCEKLRISKRRREGRGKGGVE